MIKLLFVDDQPAVLRFLENTFKDQSKYQLVGSLTRSELVEIWCEEKEPDAIFLDIHTKEKATNGLEVAKKISEKFPQIKILIMTGFDEISYLEKAKEAGAHAFISKSYTEAFFIETLDKVFYEGKEVFPEEEIQTPVVPGESNLTEREIEVLRLVCQDKTNKEIAEILFISESTVKKHLENLFRKTEKKGRAGLVAHAMAGGWINPFI